MAHGIGATHLEAKEIIMEGSDERHVCSTCKHKDKDEYDDPCCSCSIIFHTVDEWEPKD